MAKQKYDHTEEIDARLRHWKRLQDVQWAAQVVLEEGPRKLVLAQVLHIRHSDGASGAKLQIEKSSKRRNADPFEWCDEDRVTLGEQGTARLLQYLLEQHSIPAVVLRPDHCLTAGQDASAVVHRVLDLLRDGDLNPGDLGELKGLAQQRAYREAVSELERLLGGERKEQAFQEWFEKHSWAFGTHYVGRVAARTIGIHDKVDFLLRTTDGYLDIIELKRPDMDPLLYDRDHKSYYWSADASKPIGQCAKYLKTVADNRMSLVYGERLPFLRPRARIIIGRSNNWPSDKCDALRSLNASLHDVEVWTYDHALAAARQLVECWLGPDSRPDDGDEAGDGVPTEDAASPGA